MATRFNSKSKPRFDIAPLPSGFGAVSTPNDLAIPSVGVEDVDAALHNLFDVEIPLNVTTAQGIKRVPVITAAGEKWALLKEKHGLRDRNNSLILPLITIIRTTVQQNITEDITGRGINQQTGELVIKRRLNHEDRAYQGLINRLGLRHQKNVAVHLGQNALETTNVIITAITNRLIAMGFGTTRGAQF